MKRTKTSSSVNSLRNLFLLLSLLSCNPTPAQIENLQNGNLVLAIKSPVTFCKVQLLSPGNNGALDQSRIKNGKVKSIWTFQWSKCPGATKYHLYVIGPDAVNPIVNEESIKATSYVESSEHYGITKLQGWTWRVRAYVNGTWEEWSDTYTFNVNPISTPSSISGRVSGKLKWEIQTTANGKKEVMELKFIILEDLESAQRTQARILDGRYEFLDVVAGKKYKLYPENFRSNPPSITVECKPNKAHNLATFNITGPPRYD